MPILTFYSYRNHLPIHGLFGKLRLVQEQGIARFDVVQQQDDPTCFVLVEVYRTSDAPARHKETAHYQKWRDTVADMMTEPRTSVKYTNVFPDEQGWD